MNSSNVSHFTDEEIKEQLNILGFKNIPRDKFELFKRDLEKLISSENSVNSSQSFTESNQPLQVSYQYENSRKKVTFPYEKTLSVSTPKILDDAENAENTENDLSFVSVTTTNSIVDNKVMKRKIIRKQNQVDDQNKTLEDLTKNFKQINFKNESIHSEDNDQKLDESNDISEQEETDAEYYSEDEQSIKMDEFYPAVNYPVKSFIRCQSALSLRSNDLKQNLKSNPVKKYQEYQKIWNRHKVPGEKKHNDLRWSIREQMLQKDIVVKRKQKTHKMNTYTVPTDKKRQHLRWLVRSAMANPVDVL